MDQVLYDFGSITPTAPHGIVSHFKGQLYLGCATLLVKKAVKDQGLWRDSSDLPGLLFLLAFDETVVSQYSGWC